MDQLKSSLTPSSIAITYEVFNLSLYSLCSNLKQTSTADICHLPTAFTRPRVLEPVFTDPIVAPKPKPRKNRPSATSSTFQSHVVQNWEHFSPVKEQTAEFNNHLSSEDVSR